MYIIDLKTDLVLKLRIQKRYDRAIVATYQTLNHLQHALKR